MVSCMQLLLNVCRWIREYREYTLNPFQHRFLHGRQNIALYFSKLAYSNDSALVQQFIPPIALYKLSYFYISDSEALAEKYKQKI